MDLIELYRYFAKFVPVKVLKENYVRSGSTSDAESIQAEVLADESDHRIDTIGDFLFLGDADFMLQRLRNSNKQILMVDSDREDYRPNADDGSKATIGLTIAEHYNRSNTDVVSELALQNKCLQTLKSILDHISTDMDGGCEKWWIDGDLYEIRFFDAKALNGLIGYTAFFTITSPSYGK